MTTLYGCISFLAGVHRRCGRDSPVSTLPSNILRAIVCSLDGEEDEVMWRVLVHAFTEDEIRAIKSDCPGAVIDPTPPGPHPYSIVTRVTRHGIVRYVWKNIGPVDVPDYIDNTTERLTIWPTRPSDELLYRAATAFASKSIDDLIHECERSSNCILHRIDSHYDDDRVSVGHLCSVDSERFIAFRVTRPPLQSNSCAHQPGWLEYDVCREKQSPQRRLPSSILSRLSIIAVHDGDVEEHELTITFKGSRKVTDLSPTIKRSTRGRRSKDCSRDMSNRVAPTIKRSTRGRRSKDCSRDMSNRVAPIIHELSLIPRWATEKFIADVKELF